MADNFDFLVANTLDLNGTLTAESVDNDGIPNKVLQNGIANSITVNWTLTGNLITADALTGTWQVQAFFERIGGGGAEFALPAAPITVPWNHAAPGVYSVSIPIPANTVPTGAYKVVVLVSHLNSANNPTRMAGFVELTMVRFY